MNDVYREFKVRLRKLEVILPDQGLSNVDRARTFSVSERDRLIRLAVQCGAVLARGGALEAERTARPERLKPGS